MYKKKGIMLLIAVVLFFTSCDILRNPDDFIAVYKGEKYIDTYQNAIIRCIWKPTLETSGEEVEVFLGEVSEEVGEENTIAITYKNDKENNLLLLAEELFVKESYYKTLPDFRTIDYDETERIVIVNLDGTTFEVKNSEHKKVLFEQLQEIANSNGKESNWKNYGEHSADSAEGKIFLIIDDLPLAMYIGWYYKLNDGEEYSYWPNIGVDQSWPNIWVMDEKMVEIINTAEENGAIKPIFEN